MEFEPKCANVQTVQLSGHLKWVGNEAVPVPEGQLYTYTPEEAQAAMADHEAATNMEGWCTYVLIDDETDIDGSYTKVQVSAPDAGSAILIGILRMGLWNEDAEILYHAWSPSLVVAAEYPDVLHYPLTFYTDNCPGPCVMVDGEV